MRVIIEKNYMKKLIIAICFLCFGCLNPGDAEKNVEKGFKDNATAVKKEGDISNKKILKCLDVLATHGEVVKQLKLSFEKFHFVVDSLNNAVSTGKKTFQSDLKGISEPMLLVNAKRVLDAIDNFDNSSSLCETKEKSIILLDMIEKMRFNDAEMYSLMITSLSNQVNDIILLKLQCEIDQGKF